MKFVGPLTFLAAVPAAFAQNWTFLEGLLDTLHDSGCTSFTQLATSLNGSTQGQYLLSAISNGDSYVLFAPNDTAVSNAPSNLTSNAIDVISYHIVSGNFSHQQTTYPNVTLGRTFLNDTTYVSLEGDKSQVVAWATRSDGNVHVLNQRNDSIVTNVTSYGNITINVVTSVLEYPDNFSDTVTADTPDLDGLGATVSNITQSFYNHTDGTISNQTVSGILDGGFNGFTLFAPNTSAISAIASSITSYEQNATLIDIILGNHIINGTSVYSPELVGINYTSAAGQTFSSHINSTGKYVTMGSTTALILQPDVLLSNGVIHIINQVLLDTDENSSAASSAVESATSAAAQSTTETRPIGYSETASLASGANAGSSDTLSHSAGIAVRGPSAAQMVALGFTAVGILVGGFVAMA